MKKRLSSFILAGILATGGIFAQAPRTCATMENLNRILTENPALLENMKQIEDHTNTVIANRSALQYVSIPVVVHVLYNTTAQNISDAQITSQIDVLNEDFRRMNADKSNTPSAFSSVAADAQINFCLASRNPQGNATTGIIRKQTSVTSFIDDDKVKYSSSGGDDAWPSSQYLNLWVCNLGNGLLGYAQFPGGPAATDGVVILYSAFGRTGTVYSPYNKGRTTTHEVGHWLNLRHIWGDASCGNDLVSDTPTQQSENYGCPSYPHSTCSNSSDMFMNYMDYTDDGCMNMFSSGQASRMNALFASGGARAGLLTSLGCTSPSGTTTCSVPASLSVSGVATTSVTLNWGSTGASSYNVRYKTSASTTWISTTSAVNYKSISALTAGTGYEFQVQSVCGTTSSSFSASKTFTTSTTTTVSATSTITVGSGTSTSSAPYGTYYMDEHTQIILTPAELAAAGYTSAKPVIKSLALNVASASGQTMNGFTIKLRHTTASSFTSTSFLSSTNLVTVFSGNINPATGWNTHTFTTGFTYNGTDNLLVDICWNNSSYTSDTKVYGTSLSTYNTLYKQADYSASSVCADAYGSRSAVRPNIRLTMGSTAARFGDELFAGEAPGEDNMMTDISNSKGAFKIYPNPAQDVLNIDFSELTDDANATVVIYNLLGETIATFDAANSSSVNVSLRDEQFLKLVPGLYICTLRYGGKSVSERLIIQ